MRQFGIAGRQKVHRPARGEGELNQPLMVEVILTGCRAAEKRIAKRIHEFSREMYLVYGARIGLYAAYIKINGEKTWGL